MKNVNVNAEVKELNYLEERVPFLIRQFEKLAPYKPKKREKGDANNNIKGWKALAIDEAGYLMTRYPDNTAKSEEDKTYSTCLSYVSQLKKALLKDRNGFLEDPAVTNQVKTIILNFHQQLLDCFAIYRARKNADYKARKDERSEASNHIEIDPTEQLKTAAGILEQIHFCPTVENRTDVDWEDVSCALALATGRRMAEIHYSGTFEKESEYSIIFTGQLKGKNRTEIVDGKELPLIKVPFSIPTLVKADYVLAGFKWLADNGKICDEQKKVNSNVSRYVNDRSRAIWDVFPEFEEILERLGKKDYYEDSTKKGKSKIERDYTMTYHKFRSIYMLLVATKKRTSSPNMGLKELTNFYKSVLGDNDPSTLEAYERFKLAEEAITEV